MVESADHLPDDTAALKAALIETRAKLEGAQALIEHLQLVIAKMTREMFGPRSERGPNSSRFIFAIKSCRCSINASAPESLARASISAALSASVSSGSGSDVVAIGRLNHKNR